MDAAGDCGADGGVGGADGTGIGCSGVGVVGSGSGTGVAAGGTRSGAGEGAGTGGVLTRLWKSSAGKALKLKAGRIGSAGGMIGIGSEELLLDGEGIG